MSESPDTEYTPTTDEILRGYSLPYRTSDGLRMDESFADWLARTSIDTHQLQMASEAAARRWLAAHDREVAAKALEDAAAEWEAEEFYTDGAASYFRTRAACIREGNTK